MGTRRHAIRVMQRGGATRSEALQACLFRPAGRNEGGFTFLELILVIAVLGMLFAISIPSLEGFAPRYRLRTAARQIGTTLEQLRLAALSRGVWLGVHYVLTPDALSTDDASYYQQIQPPPEDNPDQPVAERQLMEKDTLPSGVRISKIILSNGHVVDRGTVNVLFSPMGNAGSHIVVIEDLEGRIFSLKMSCITGTIEMHEGTEAAFQHFAE